MWLTAISCAAPTTIEPPTDEHLRGELRAADAIGVKYHVKEKESYFEKVGDEVYRRNKVFRSVRDKRTGNEIANELIVENNAKVLYDHSLINAPIRQDVGGSARIHAHTLDISQRLLIHSNHPASTRPHGISIHRTRRL
ncbi:hypothetical protein CVS30_03735 [Arthrobacter psychrolactophilus]|uniref:Uncharacterized protein n=1 Tax=Arthrobacter psychrolactophilus TaxID=92442 RepID=A0A2V5IWB1_9MICC|nr:hypothetical protein [Arthrobacter psychrolactophilus]PYI39782.1 hypothetical protein CVS30_03735 [Arthrobacter psychrolactophilus]